MCVCLSVIFKHLFSVSNSFLVSRLLLRLLFFHQLIPYIRYRCCTLGIASLTFSPVLELITEAAGVTGQLTPARVGLARQGYAMLF